MTVVQRVSKAQVVIRPAVVIFAIPDGYALRTVCGEHVSVHGDRRALIDADSQQIWMRLHHDAEIVLAAARIDVLIDGGIGEEAEACFVSRCHHDGVVVRFIRSANHVRCLDARARRAAADHAAAVDRS